MYGTVNRAIEELVITDLGENAGEAVKVSADVEVDIFISDSAYPDHLTFALLAAVSERLVIPLPEFIRKFGIHWVMITPRRDHGDVLLAGGSVAPEGSLHPPECARLHQPHASSTGPTRFLVFK